MLASMTGFARVEGAPLGGAGLSWAWELRSVNGRGLELRLRLPPGFDPLEPGLREAAAGALRRGTVTANLTVRADEAPRLALDAIALEQALALALALAARIPGAPPPRAEALLVLPGVLRQPAAAASAEVSGDADAAAAIRAGFAAATAALVQARQAEGGRLAAILAGLLDEIAALHASAAELAAAQPATLQARLIESVTPLLQAHPALPAERIAQEVALLAARSDVREELDRLAAHVAAARGFLTEGGPVGRRFEFLLQEFNREVNTLCSKSALTGLTTIGLRLKAAIEQLREQVANVE